MYVYVCKLNIEIEITYEKSCKILIILKKKNTDQRF